MAEETTTQTQQQGVGAAYDFEQLDNPQIKAILAQEWEGGNFSSRVWNNNQLFAEQVRDTVSTGILSGQSFNEMSHRLEYVAGADEPAPAHIGAEREKPRQGTRSGASARSMRLIRTEACRAASVGQLMSLEEAGLKEYRFIATLDLLTSKVCRELDMKVFPISGAKAGVNCPPMHPNCRSVIAAVVSPELLKLMGRAARDPETGKTVTVPGDMTYQEWYDKFVKSSKTAEGKGKALHNKATDRKQFERYHSVLGDYAPKTLEEFRQVKYNEPEKFSNLRVLHMLTLSR